MFNSEWFRVNASNSAQIFVNNLCKSTQNERCEKNLPFLAQPPDGVLARRLMLWWATTHGLIVFRVAPTSEILRVAQNDKQGGGDFLPQLL
jgi:hypothetical protein